MGIPPHNANMELNMKSPCLAGLETTDSRPATTNAPHAHEAHLVQLYSDDGLLLDVLCRFIGGAIAIGDGGIVIATKAHLEGLASRLRAKGFDTTTAINQGRYIPVDAEETLPRIMSGGQVNEARFNEIVGELLTRVRSASECPDSRIAVFGELVALLWAGGKAEEALRLEQLWNNLGQKHYFSLLCAYPITGFDNDRRIEPFLKMCSQHSGVVPSESYVGLTTIEERLRTIADLQQRTRALEHALKLRQSEERFRLLVEAVQDYAIFMLDTEGYIVSWNNGAQRIKGYQGAEIIGKHFSCFYPPADLKSDKPRWELEIAAKDGRFEDEGWRIRKDGSRFWASVIITAVRDESGKLIGFAKVTRDFTERMRTQDALRQEIIERREIQRKLYDSEQSLRQLSKHLLRTQDEERRRIGRELHDSLGQSMAAMKINLDALSSLVDAEGTAGQKVSECIQLAETGIKEVRTISYLLYPPMLEEMGLKAAIPWYLDGFSSRSGIAITFEVADSFDRLYSDGELALFRVLQESLTNIHRHSGSPTARVRLRQKDGMVFLEIQDQGKGLKPALLERLTEDWTGAPGVGLRGMNERMQQLGGRLELSSTGKGTTLTAIIPLVESSATPTEIDRNSRIVAAHPPPDNLKK
jgi:PAS domain S-box-containing protein